MRQQWMSQINSRQVGKGGESKGKRGVRRPFTAKCRPLCSLVLSSLRSHCYACAWTLSGEAVVGWRGGWRGFTCTPSQINLFWRVVRSSVTI
jgi:hypothetical protein